MLEYWIWLTTRPGLGRAGALRILRHFGDPEQAYLADEAAYRQIEGLRDSASLLNKDLKQAEAILEQCYRKNIHILTYQDAAYPERLRNIDDAPMLLYYQGTLPNIDALPVITMVGTRRASAYGMTHAKQLGYQIGKAGAVVASGGAGGIDTMALVGALTAGNPVIAVLGCGVDVDYPAANHDLFQDIRYHGCLLSEYPPGTPAKGDHFPVRNRILSGIAVGVVVVEAPEKSGALITASRALDQGRDVFTIPADLGNESCRGNIQLLKNGAIAIEDGWDVISEYTARFPGLLVSPGAVKPMELTWKEQEAAASAEQKPLFVASNTEKPKSADKKTVDNTKSRTYIDLQEILDKLNADEAAIMRQLSGKPVHIDVIIENTQLPAPRVTAALLMLRVKGFVQSLPAKFYTLAEKKQK